MTTAGTHDPLRRALARAGGRIRHVRYRANRTVLLSVSRDGRTLNSHACFREAPPAIIQAIVTFTTARRGSAEHSGALASLREWEGTRRGLERARAERPPERRRSSGTQTAESAELGALYQQLNDRHFRGQLPTPGLRISRRMTRALGKISYGGGSDRRWVREIALSADLLADGNGEALVETLLHEMAHAEAWLRHGHRGHGRIWREIAERVGCTPRALTSGPVRRSGR